MNPPTMLELCDQATPGPWGYDLNHTVGHHDGGEWLESVVQLPVGVHSRRPTQQEQSDCILIARCSPETMRKVVEALTSALGLARIVEPSDDEDLLTVANLEQLTGQLSHALALLNGKSQE